MKRRNVDCVKPRRILKRTKIAEGFCRSSYVYVKFVFVWLLVISLDYLFEFRFEYLWPFWLLLRSVYDSFRYQGLAFSILFICMALTSDMVCLLFIPVNWLFFAASTYVWVQFVWQSERGICMPSVVLWVLFIYIEALVRIKDIKNGSFHLDLCRPFAAHCIGYPVVTLGFGFKSYVGYRLRQRKQQDVAKENEFYFQILQEALPCDIQSSTDKGSKEKAELQSKDHDVSSYHNFSGIIRSLSICNGPLLNSHSSSNNNNMNNINNNNTNNKNASLNINGSASKASRTAKVVAGSIFSSKDEQGSPPLKLSNKVSNGAIHPIDLEYSLKKGWVRPKTVNDFDEWEADREKSAKSLPPSPAPSTHALADAHDTKRSNSASSSSSSSQSGGPSAKLATTHSNNLKESPTGVSPPTKEKKPKNNKEVNRDNAAFSKDECVSIIRLEADVKRLKADLQSSRQTEQDLRNQVNGLLSCEKQIREENQQLHQDNDNLQNKLHNLVTGRQSDRCTIGEQEKRVQEERKARAAAEHQVAQLERKVKRLEDQNQSKSHALAVAKSECSESCRSRRDDLDSEVDRVRRENRALLERCRSVERENSGLRQYKESQGEAEVLMSALSAMQEKMAQLESNLSAETKIKLDLFSALGEAKRQLSIAQNQMVGKEKEVEDLKSKFTEVLAVCSSPAPISPDLHRAYASKLLPPSTPTSKLMHSPPQEFRDELLLPDAVSRPSEPAAIGGSPGAVRDSSLSVCLPSVGHLQALTSPKGSAPSLSNLDPNARAYTPKGDI